METRQSKYKTAEKRWTHGAAVGLLVLGTDVLVGMLLLFSLLLLLLNWGDEVERGMGEVIVLLLSLDWEGPDAADGVAGCWAGEGGVPAAFLLFW